jgi:hypothetical protein
MMAIMKKKVRMKMEMKAKMMMKPISAQTTNPTPLKVYAF